MYFIKKINILLILSFVLAYPTKQDFSNAFIKVAEKGNPAIVSIISKKIIENHHHFFFDYGTPNQNKKHQSLGSGVIVDSKNGYIITNNHVIENAKEIKVILLDKREIKAEIIATDPPSDIAIIKVEPIGLNSIKIGDSEKLKVGEWIVAIGSPFGLHLNHTVTAGIISAIGRNDVMSKNNFENFIQHDAAINPGNSGGGLFNLNGELIGINTAIATDGFSRGNAGVGFAIPINMVNRIIADLILDGKVTRGWLGVSIQDINNDMANALKLKNRNGALISHVISNSPAENAGIKNQDIIISVNEEKINDSSQLKNLISNGRPKDKTVLTVIRDGRKKTIVVTLGKRPDQEELSNVYQYGNQRFDILGLTVKTNQYGSSNENGVMVNSIKPNSPASENDIQKKDIIVVIGKSIITNIDDYNSELDNYKIGDTIMLRILRDNNPFYLAFEIK